MLLDGKVPDVPGVRAVRGVYQAIVKDLISPTITPDGPRGPRFVAKPGAIFTAQISGKAVVPIAYAARPAKLLRTWDKFVIPWPFATIYFAIGEPFYPKKKRLTDTYLADPHVTGFALPAPSAAEDLADQT